MNKNEIKVDCEKASNFGTILKKIRTKREFSLKGFSWILGFTPNYLNNLEKGKKIPTLQIIKTICEKITLSEEEIDLLTSSYNDAHPSVDSEIINYLIENSLIDYIKILKEIDPSGSKIKTLAINSKKN